MVEKLALDTATFGSRFNDLLKVPCKTMKAWISSEADEPTTEIGPFTKEKLKSKFELDSEDFCLDPGFISF